MKNKKRAGVLCLIGMIFLGGCGAAPYQLTEREESIIVNYAAHIVSKYNIYQSGGLTYVSLNEDNAEIPEEFPESTEMEEPADAQEENGVPEASGSSGSAQGEETDADSADINDLFGGGGLHISYEGYELKKAYVQNSVYAMEAPAGKTYLVLNFDLANETGEEILADNLSLNPAFRISYTDENGNEKSASSFLTILLNDFSTFEGIVEAQETVRTVLLFEVPETVSAVNEIVLKAVINQNNYNINL